jgi:hypothetical protein
MANTLGGISSFGDCDGTFERIRNFVGGAYHEE